MKKVLLTTFIALCINYSIAQPTAGLVAYWPMNGNFNDAGPNGINGTNIGATATTNNNSVANTAMNFNNPTATVVQNASHPVNANLSFGTAQDFSIDFSFFIASPFLHTGGIYDNCLNNSGYGVWYWTSGGFLQLYFNFKNGAIGTTNGALAVNTWYNICCVRESGILKIYVNGVLNNSGAEGAATPNYTYAARFGTMYFNAGVPPEYNGHNGKIDEMRIYNRALSAIEVGALAILPIKLTSFIATKNNDDILLQWKTEYEQNSAYFNVQRSTDGINFSTITTIQAKGNSSVISQYQYLDNTAKALNSIKTVFYRLEMVDIDAKKVNSAIVSVKLNNKQKELQVLENPVKNDLRIQFSSTNKEMATIIITDVSGRQLIKKAIEINAGIMSTAIPVNWMAPAVYYITLINSQGTQTQTFLKQ